MGRSTAIPSSLITTWAGCLRTWTSPSLSPSESCSRYLSCASGASHLYVSVHCVLRHTLAHSLTHICTCSRRLLGRWLAPSLTFSFAGASCHVFTDRFASFQCLLIKSRPQLESGIPAVSVALCISCLCATLPDAMLRQHSAVP